MRMDLNCDLGESFGPWEKGMDAEVMAHITSANIACGFHAGDPQIMNHTVALATKRGVRIGAHPGYPDLQGFGRRAMDCTPEEVRAYILYQVGALEAFARTHQSRVNYVKPHGAMYHAAMDNPQLARAILQSLAEFGGDLRLVVMAGRGLESMRETAAEFGVQLITEAFPDRAYTPQGLLVPRRTPGAVIHDPAEVASRAVMMAVEGKVLAFDGKELPIQAQTFCVHGDNPAAVHLVRSIRESLESCGVKVASFL
jgi:UPF0271 protein